MRKIFTVVMVVALVCGFAASSSAQIGFNGIGGRLGFVNSDLPDGAIIFGAHADLGEIIENLKLVPSIDYFSANNVNFLSINANARYYFPTDGDFSFFAGGGLGFVRVSVDDQTFTDPFTGFTVTAGGGSNTEIALNLKGGADYPISDNLIATGEIIYVTEGGQIKIMAGITYLLGN